MDQIEQQKFETPQPDIALESTKPLLAEQVKIVIERLEEALYLIKTMRTGFVIVSGAAILSGIMGIYFNDPTIIWASVGIESVTLPFSIILHNATRKLNSYISTKGK